MTDMDKMMIEERRLIAEWDATSEFTTDDLYLFTEALVGAVRAAISAYNPDDRLREALEEIIAVTQVGGIDPIGVRSNIRRIAYTALSSLPQGDGRIAELAKKAEPLLRCDHRAIRPNPRVASERIVGFVLGEDDIGMGLSEPLFALAALVELARHAMMSGGGAQSAIAHE